MELVSPGIGLIFWMTLAFGILLFILGKFVWPPIMRALHDREQAIELALHEADKARKEMEELKFSNEQLLREAKEERDGMLRDARKVRENIIESARIKANEEANRIIESATERIHFEKMAAMTELKNQIANLSIEIAEKVLGQELSNPEKDKAIVQKSIGDITLN
ncbi:MAG: F0F1 ATP synthase subunit B [Bacteroidales bacterium]|jgi:F-type H+-transporting ATPase subunit b|nr:F0F1 ATP synthase subunit B [Bacteroidales bacterium]